MVIYYTSMTIEISHETYRQAVSCFKVLDTINQSAWMHRQNENENRYIHCSKDELVQVFKSDFES